jgi:hypothetical protein
MQVVNILIKDVYQILIHLMHTFLPNPSHISHLISLSLGDEIDSRSDLASTAKAGNQHKTQGKGRNDSSL